MVFCPIKITSMVPNSTEIKRVLNMTYKSLSDTVPIYLFRLISYYYFLNMKFSNIRTSFIYCNSMISLGLEHSHSSLHHCNSYSFCRFQFRYHFLWNFPDILNLDWLPLLNHTVNYIWSLIYLRPSLSLKISKTGMVSILLSSIYQVRKWQK